MTDRRARIETLLESPLANHAEIRALLLPDGEDGGPKPWLPNLPDAEDGWDDVWTLVARAVIEALVTAEGPARDPLFEVLAVCPSPESVTFARSVVLAAMETSAIHEHCLDLLVQGLGQESAPILEQAVGVSGTAAAVHAVMNLTVLPPEFAIEPLARVVANRDLGRAPRTRAAQALLGMEDPAAVTAVARLAAEGTGNRTIDRLLGEKVAARSKAAEAPPAAAFVPAPLRFAEVPGMWTAESEAKWTTLTEGILSGNERGIPALLIVGQAPALVPRIHGLVAESSEIRETLRRRVEADPGDQAAFPLLEVMS